MGHLIYQGAEKISWFSKDSNVFIDTVLIIEKPQL